MQIKIYSNGIDVYSNSNTIGFDYNIDFARWISEQTTDLGLWLCDCKTVNLPQDKKCRKCGKNK